MTPKVSGMRMASVDEQVLNAAVRLAMQDATALERKASAIDTEMEAKGAFNYSGTIRRIVDALIEQLRETTNRLIAAHVMAGARDAGVIAAAVHAHLEPFAAGFLAKQATKRAGAGTLAFKNLEPEVQAVLQSVQDQVVLAIARQPESTDRVISDIVPPRTETGWQRVDTDLAKAQERLASASSESDYQGVGHLCREVLISVAQAVFDPARHPPLDETKPSDTDAKRMLGAFFAAELSGDAQEELRRHGRAALDVSVALQHKRTADVRYAALCLEATSSVV